MPKTTREGTVRWRIGSSFEQTRPRPTGRETVRILNLLARKRKEGNLMEDGRPACLSTDTERTPVLHTLNPHRKRLGVRLCAQGQAREAALQQRHQSRVPVADHEQDQ